MARLHFLFAVGAAAVCAACDATAEVFPAESGSIKVEVLASGLHHPWGMALLPDGSMLVSERRGRLLRIAGGTAVEVAGVPPVAARGQGGLFDLALDEAFATSRRLWFSYAEPGEGGAGTALATATLSADGSRLEGVRRLFAMARKTEAAHHFGGRIALAPDGKLFLTTGDRGEAARAQDSLDHAGAVIRLNRDGTIPSDNPFADGAKGLPELWSKGHRNIQGAVFDAGVLWTVEHGAMGGDEVNRPLPGRNYGWPTISYGRNYDGAKIGIGVEAPGLEQPVHYWDPSIAPSGATIYNGKLFAEWKGDLLVAALKYQMLVRLDIENGQVVGEERLLQGAFGRMRDVESFADGAIYILTDESDGKLLRLTPAR
jgi:glucose/arabinose dehydrogenase